MIFQKIISIFFLRGGGAFASIFITFIISRTLPPKEAASFFIFISLSTILSINLRWGSDEAIIRAVATTPKEHIQQTYSTTQNFFKIRLRKNTLALLIATPALLLINTNIKILEITNYEIMLAITTSYTMAAMNFYARFLQGEGKSSTSLFFLNLFTPYLFIAFYLLSKLTEPINLITPSLLYLSASIICLYILASSFNRTYNKNPPAQQREILLLKASSNSLAMVILSQQLFNWGTQIMVPALYSAEEYNYFTISQKTASAIGLLMVIVNFSLSSIYAKLYQEKNIGKIKSIIKKSFFSVVIFSTLLALIFYFLSHPILDFAKATYHDEGRLFHLLILSQIMNTIASFFSVILSMVKQESFLMKSQVAINSTGFLVFGFICLSQNLQLAISSIIITYCILSLSLMIKTYKTIWSHKNV